MTDLVEVVIPGSVLIDFRNTALDEIDRVTRRSWLAEMNRVLLRTRGEPDQR